MCSPRVLAETCRSLQLPQPPEPGKQHLCRICRGQRRCWDITASYHGQVSIQAGDAQSSFSICVWNSSTLQPGFLRKDDCAQTARKQHTGKHGSVPSGTPGYHNCYQSYHTHFCSVLLPLTWFPLFCSERRVSALKTASSPHWFWSCLCIQESQNSNPTQTLSHFGNIFISLNTREDFFWCFSIALQFQQNIIQNQSKEQ